MYLVNKNDLRGIEDVEVKARLDIVNYITEWAEEVFYIARDKKTISLAGRYIRSEVLYKGDALAKLMDAVVLVDLADFWKAVDGGQGKRDDVILYGIFCMLFSEVNADMKEESKKLEGNIGYAPRLRFDISERRESEVDESKKKKKGLIGLFSKSNKKVEKEVATIQASDDIIEGGYDIYEEEELDEEEEIVEIDDKYVTPENVQKLTIVAVGVISALVIILAWMILI